MQRYTAELEGSGALSPQWLEEILQPLKEWIHGRKRVEIADDRFRHIVSDVLGDSFVGDQNINDGGLSDIFDNTPERAFLYRHPAIERDVF